MRRLALIGLAVLACTKTPTAAPEASLVAAAKQALARRDGALASYRVVVDSAQGEAKAHHEFFYRAPNRVRGVVTAPDALTLSFDGTKLFKVTPAEKRFLAFEVKLPREKAAWFLTTQFSPFVPEGYRTPLLPSKGVTAKHVEHPLAKDAVALTVDADDGAGGQAVVTWTLRLPAGDFLGKRTESGGQVVELVVNEEHCDAALKLCVPKRLTQSEGGAVVGTTTVTEVSLNVALPSDDFTLTAPEGYAVEQRSVVEEGP